MLISPKKQEDPRSRKQELFPSEYAAQAFYYPDHTGQLRLLDFSKRMYMVPIYDTPNQRVLLKFGRQSEKTVVESTPLLMASGALVPIRDVRVGDRVISMLADGAHLGPAEVVAKTERYRKRGVRITTRLGHVVEVGYTHPVRQWERWTIADALKKGDRIASVRRFPTTVAATEDPRLLAFLGYVLGDGHCGKVVAFTQDADSEALVHFRALCHSLGWDDYKEYPKAGSNSIDLRFRKSSAAYRYIESLGLSGCLSGDKFIPAKYMQLTPELTLALVQAMWACDGHVSKKSGCNAYEIVYCTISLQMARQLQALLWKLGIPTRMRVQTPKAYVGTSKRAYLLHVRTREGIERFLTVLKIPGKSAELPAEESNDCRDTLPMEAGTEVYRRYSRLPCRHGSTAHADGVERMKLRYPPSRTKFAAMLEYLSLKGGPVADLQAHQDTDIVWDEVSSVEDMGEQWCYDIEVAGTHSYVAAGLITHNSTLLGNKIITFSHLRPNLQSLYVSPADLNTTTFSRDRITIPIMNSALLRSLVDPRNNNVLYKRFVNGSDIRFRNAFLNADRIRGNPCQNLVIDESVRYGTLVSTPTGTKPIEQFNRGDAVVSFDEQGVLHHDEVDACMDHGTRDCYRFEFGGGQTLELTSDSWVATTDGWKRAADIIRNAGGTDTRAGTAATRHYAGRRLHDNRRGQEPAIPQPARLGTARVQLPQVPGPIRVRTYAAQESEERRLRRISQLLGNRDLSSALAYRVYVSSRGEEAGDEGVARLADVGRDRVVVPGRRASVAGKQRDVPHGGVHARGGRSAGRNADRARPAGEGAADQIAPRRGARLPRDRADGGVDVHVRGVDSSVCRARDAVQAVGTGTRTRSAVRVVRKFLRAAAQNHPSALQGEQVPCLLRRGGVRKEARGGRYREVPRDSGRPGSEQRAWAGQVLRGRRGVAREESPRDGGAIRDSRREGGGTAGQAALSCEDTGGARSHAVGMPAVPSCGAAREEGRTLAVLPGLPGDCSTRNQPALRTEEERGARLQEGVLRSIVWTGRHRVYDLEVKRHHTFLAGGVAVHNCQDILLDVIPVIEETQSHSEFLKLRTYAGTPKSFDNTIEAYWSRDSTQYEWMIPCDSCGSAGKGQHRHWFTIGYDHIGLKGYVCDRCGKPINPHHPAARWVSMRSAAWLKDPPIEFPFDGFHVSQPMTPWTKHADIVDKKRRYGPAEFHNEVLGLSYETGERVIRRQALVDSYMPGVKLNDLQGLMGKGPLFMGIDWGGGGCHDDQTRLLTETGFKFFKDVTVLDRVAQFDVRTRALTFVHPLHVTKKRWSGELVHFKQPTMDVLVTPAHRMVTYSVGGNGPGALLVERADQLITRDSLRRFAGVITWDAAEVSTYTLPAQPRSAGYRWEPPVELPMDLWLEFLGYYLSEGGLCKGNASYSCLKMSQRETVNPGKTASIRGCLERLRGFGFKISEFPNHKTGDRNWTLYGKRLWRWVADNVGVSGCTKRIPRDVMRLPKQQLQLLWDAMMLGDGRIDKRPGCTNGRYDSTSEGLCDDFLELCTLLGLRAYKYVSRAATGNQRTRWSVGWSHGRDHNVKNPSKAARVPYDGMVYCCTVPKGAIVTERNGCIAMHGNSDNQSYTHLCIGGYAGDRFVVPYWKRFEGAETEIDRMMEEIFRLITQYRVHLIGTDYGGGYHTNDKLIRKFGVEKILRYQYVNTQKLYFDRTLARFMANRTEVMMAVANAINRVDTFAFPQIDRWEVPHGECFLNIFSEYNKHNSTMTISRVPGKPDDGYHALVFCFLASMLVRPRHDILSPDKDR